MAKKLVVQKNSDAIPTSPTLSSPTSSSTANSLSKLHHDVLRCVSEFLSAYDFVSLMLVSRNFMFALSPLVPKVKDDLGAWSYKFWIFPEYWEVERRAFFEISPSSADGYTILLRPTEPGETVSIPEGFQRELRARKQQKPHIWSQLEAVEKILDPTKYGKAAPESRQNCFIVWSPPRWRLYDSQDKKVTNPPPFQFDNAEIAQERKWAYHLVKKYGQLLHRAESGNKKLNGVYEIIQVPYYYSTTYHGWPRELHYIDDKMHGRSIEWKGTPRETYCDFNMGKRHGSEIAVLPHHYPSTTSFHRIEVWVEKQWENDKLHGTYTAYALDPASQDKEKTKDLLVCSRNYVENKLDGTNTEYFVDLRLPKNLRKSIKVLEEKYLNGVMQEDTRWDYKLPSHKIYHCKYTRAGKKDGPEIQYHPATHNTKEGDPPLIMTTVTWVKGERQGKEQRYHRNGKIAFEATWKNDYLTGEQRVFSDQGNLLHECTWDRKRPGVKTGKEQQWSERTGQLIYSATHKDGKETKVQRWDDNGKPY